MTSQSVFGPHNEQLHVIQHDGDDSNVTVTGDAAESIPLSIQQHQQQEVEEMVVEDDATVEARDAAETVLDDGEPTAHAHASLEPMTSDEPPIPEAVHEEEVVNEYQEQV